MSEAAHPIASLRREARQLSSLEAAIRARYSIEQKRLAMLQHFRLESTDDMAYASNGLFDITEKAIRQDVSRLNLFLEKISRKLSAIPSSEKWDRFQEMLKSIDTQEEVHKRAKEQARDQLNAHEFWARVSEAKCWLDVQLPEEDLEYRRAVSKLNDLKDKAFSFYVGEQNELRVHHLRRFASVKGLLGEFYPDMQRAFQDVLSVIDCGGPGELWTLSPVSDISSEEMISGPFSPTRYINFLNGEVETLPIFGSPLDAPNGSRTLAKDILLPDYENATPLASVFSSVNPAEPVATCIKAAFSLETVWLKSQRHDVALASVTRTGVNGYFVDKGWLLGFMLVNLPTPLIQCNDERNLRRGVPRNVIASYLNPETEEYKLFLKIWPYTDGENIRLAAVAITQMRNSERFVEDVRTKWNPDVQRPLPIHQRLSSHSDHRHGNRTLS